MSGDSQNAITRIVRKESIVSMKIRKQLLEQEKISYAMDHIELPEGVEWEKDK